MNPRALRPVIVTGNENRSPAPSLRSVVRKLALLNAIIVLTAFPVLIFEGGPLAVGPALEVMAGISVLIWTATFAPYFFVSLPWLFRTPVSSGKRRDPLRKEMAEGVADRWQDGPV